MTEKRYEYRLMRSLTLRSLPVARPEVLRTRITLTPVPYTPSSGYDRLLEHRALVETCPTHNNHIPPLAEILPPQPRTRPNPATGQYDLLLEIHNPSIHLVRKQLASQAGIECINRKAPACFDSNPEITRQSFTLHSTSPDTRLDLSCPWGWHFRRKIYQRQAATSTLKSLNPLTVSYECRNMTSICAVTLALARTGHVGFVGCPGVGLDAAAHQIGSVLVRGVQKKLDVRMAIMHNAESGVGEV
jgi:hypothetical protein